MDDLSNFKPLTETEILDRLTGWKRALEGADTALWPLAAEMEEMQQQLAALAQTHPDKAREYRNTLVNLQMTLIQRRQEQVARGLHVLKGMKGDGDAWEQALRSTVAALEELERLSGVQESELRKDLEEQRRRLRGEALLTQARQAWERGKQAIEHQEAQKQVTLIIDDAARLYSEMRRYLDEGRSERVSSSVLNELQKLRDLSGKYYEALRRVYQGALTSDLHGQYVEAVHELEKAREEAPEGDQLMVYYVPDELADSTTLKKMTVREAIEIAKARRRRFLMQRAQNHLAKIKQYLADGEPTRALEEYNQIVGVEYIKGTQAEIDMKHIKQEIDKALMAWGQFEEEIRQASAMQDKKDLAWSMLDAVGKKEPYRLFTRTHPLWEKARTELARDIEAQVERDELVPCALHIARSEWHQARRGCESVRKRYQDWPEYFSTILTTANILIELADQLEQHLNRARIYLNEKRLEEAAAALQEANRWLLGAQQRTPGSVAQKLTPQAELQQLQDILDAYEKAGELHQRLQSQVNSTERVAELERLVQEIQGHIDRVADRYREDFEALLALATARYHYYMGRSILSVAGNPEEAKRHLVEAARHDAFQKEAQEAILDIDQKLIPANRRVKAALRKINEHRQYGRYWEAYEVARKVAEEPAERELRQKLQRQLEAMAELARRESEIYLNRALESEEGDPKLLREHLRRIRALDPNYPKENIQRLWLIIHQLEAARAFTERRWLDAVRSLGEALRVLQDMPDEGWIQELKARLNQQRMAARKQHILQIIQIGSPDETLTTLEHDPFILRQDPDVLLGLVQVTLRYIRHQEEAFENALPENFIQEEKALLQDVSKHLQEAQGNLHAAERQFRLWQVQSLPPYEIQRLDTLQTTLKAWERQRETDLKQTRSHLKAAQMIHAKKSEILHLLESVEAFQA